MIQSIKWEEIFAPLSLAQIWADCMDRAGILVTRSCSNLGATGRHGDPAQLYGGLEGGTISRWSPCPQIRVGDSMVDRDPILDALYSGALALDPPWNTSEVCAGGGGRPSSKKDDLRVTAQPLFAVPVRAACVFYRRHA